MQHPSRFSPPSSSSSSSSFSSSSPPAASSADGSIDTVPSRFHHHPALHARLDQLGRSNPPLACKLRHMALPLSPLVQLTTGAVHAHFPPTLLHFWLLTAEQLDSLAAFYHQRAPSPWSAQYPCPIAWRSDLPLEEKRRRMGMFIGLRGCAYHDPLLVAGEASASSSEDLLGSLQSEEEIAEKARRAAADDEIWRRKLSSY